GSLSERLYGAIVAARQKDGTTCRPFPFCFACSSPPTRSLDSSSCAKLPNQLAASACFGICAQAACADDLSSRNYPSASGATALILLPPPTARDCQLPNPR